jgi:hypothetical protein
MEVAAAGHAVVAAREWVSPDLARDWLAVNTHNRYVRKGLVRALAADMEAGDWRENGETIKLASDGRVIDGQHRLLAISESGVGQWMLVVRGLPMSSQDTVDTGQRRSFADVLAMRREANASRLSSVVRRALLWDRGERGVGLRSPAISNVPTIPQQLAFLERHPGLRESTAEGLAVRRRFRFIADSVLGHCHWLFSNIDEEDCGYFYSRLADGANLAVDHPIAVLRKTTMEYRNHRVRLSTDMTTAYTIKTWNFYRAGRAVSLLRFRPGGAHPEAFPEPM